MEIVEYKNKKGYKYKFNVCTKSGKFLHYAFNAKQAKVEHLRLNPSDEILSIIQVSKYPSFD